MVLTLLISLVSSQTMYEWVDAKGQSHFTNDPQSIPAGAKKRETKGAEVLVSPAATPAAAAKPVDAGVPAVVVDTCALARKQLAEVERKLEQAKVDARKVQEQASQKCQQLLRTHGEGEFARCMASRSEAPAADQAGPKQLETSRETLRQAQQNGCH